MTPKRALRVAHGTGRVAPITVIRLRTISWPESTQLRHSSRGFGEST